MDDDEVQDELAALEDQVNEKTILDEMPTVSKETPVKGQKVLPTAAKTDRVPVAAGNAKPAAAPKKSKKEEEEDEDLKALEAELGM